MAPAPEESFAPAAASCDMSTPSLTRANITWCASPPTLWNFSNVHPGFSPPDGSGLILKVYSVALISSSWTGRGSRAFATGLPAAAAIDDVVVVDASGEAPSSLPPQAPNMTAVATTARTAARDLTTDRRLASMLSPPPAADGARTADVKVSLFHPRSSETARLTSIAERPRSLPSTIRVGDAAGVSTIFMTGFPGFLGSRLAPRLLARHPDRRLVCLVQPKFAATARSRAEQLAAANPTIAGRLELVEGDLTAEGLGVADPAHLLADIAEIWHLAAVYDLSVPRELGMRVNVDGTRHVLRFAERCPGLERHHYVSTCYVSGRWCGPFRETDLEVGQTFNNFYEETKFLAEREVASARAAGMPTTVYRPAIVVGDSRTGETQKFDGPYVILRWLMRQRRIALVPVVGDPTMVRINAVPSDFVLDAIAHLSSLDSSNGLTYQLADPSPMTADEMLTAMCAALDLRAVKVRLPHRLTSWALGSIDPLERWVGIPASSVEYFLHPTHYDTTLASRDLAGSGISCPRFADYLPALIGFLRDHADADLGVMV